MIYSGEHIDEPMCAVESPRNDLVILCQSQGTGPALVFHSDSKQQTRSGADRVVVPLDKQIRATSLVHTLEGKIVVSDRNSQSLSVHDSEGGHLVTVNLRQLNPTAPNNISPSGLFLHDSTGHLYVCDVNNNEILQLDEHLRLVKIFHTRDWFQAASLCRNSRDIKNTIQGPVGVTIDSSGNIIILENSGRIKVFSTKSNDNNKGTGSNNTKRQKEKSQCIIL